MTRPPPVPIAPDAGLRTPAGERLLLGPELGRGGEARVYAVAGDPGRAVKLYTRDEPGREAKLRAMLAKVPADPDRRHGHVSIAWPEALVLDETGGMRGFLMPRIDTRRYLSLHQLYHPRSRRSRAPGISWRYLVRIARNLCATLAALHEAGYVVGDLNESNILVDDRALVTLVDLDSIQVTTVTRVFRCPVGKVEYTPPELQGRSFREVGRRPRHDRFSLAVLVFLLLMEGNHPFSGVYAGADEPPGLEDNIASRRTPWFGRSRLSPPLAAPPIELLGSNLASVLRRALVGPAPRRPSARELQLALEALEADLAACPRVTTHLFHRDMSECPWCVRAARLGIDSFPPPGAAVAVGTRQVPGATARPAAVPVIRPAAARTAGNAGPRNAAAPHPGPAGGGAGPAGGGAGQAGGAAAARTTVPPGKRTPTAAAAGYGGGWVRFHRGLPLLTAALLLLLAAPAALVRDGLLGAIAGLAVPEPLRVPLLLVATFMPPVIAGYLLYRQARASARWARALLLGERGLRSASAAALFAAGVSLLAPLVSDLGSIRDGDWRTFMVAWPLAFLALWRLVGPRRY